MKRKAMNAAGLAACLLALGCAKAETSAPIALEPVVEFGLTQPVFLTQAGDGSGRLFVLEQAGVIRVIEDGALNEDWFLDIRDRVRSGGERGLLGLAFHPDFPDERRFFVNYTRADDGATVVAEFRVGPDGSPQRSSERVLLVIEQPWGNHNGGMIAFGPDDLLYIGMGDGGSGGDPQNNGQDPDALLGKMLRIDVDGEPYAIPDGNPFADGGGRPEIFALGLRNPWRFSFDRATGELWAGDVGQNAIEEVSVVERGGNYGWRIKEGTRDYEPANGVPDDLIPPAVEYAQGGQRCSVTGGYVYRGEAVPELAGDYVFGDYCSGEIFAFDGDEMRVLLDTGYAIASFGEDAAGELYVVDHDGAIYRITGNGEA